MQGKVISFSIQLDPARERQSGELTNECLRLYLMSQQDSIYSQTASVSVFHEITVNEHWRHPFFFFIIRKIPNENDISYLLILMMSL